MTRTRPPEVLQTSAMDCGPAALASLLGCFGRQASVDALRDACATGIDGTSIDDLEEVAVGLGLDAEQLVMPFGQVIALHETHLPALLVTRTPGGYAHVVLAWLRRGRVSLVDPAVGRRTVKVSALTEEVWCHELTAPAEAWAQHALSDETADALRRRLRAAGLSEQSAALRVREAQAAGPVTGVGALLSSLEHSSSAVVEDAGHDEDGDALVRVRGAVLVRATGYHADGPTDSTCSPVVRPAISSTATTTAPGTPGNRSAPTASSDNHGRGVLEYRIPRGDAGPLLGFVRSKVGLWQLDLGVGPRHVVQLA